jgi:hypothetical protein
MKRRFTATITFTKTTTVDVLADDYADAREQAVSGFIEAFGEHDSVYVTKLVDNAPPKVAGPFVRYHHYQDEIAKMGRALAHKTESDSGVVWYLFTGFKSEAEAANHLHLQGVNTGSYRCGCAHDCCGCSHNGAMWFKQVGNRILAQQSFGRNI